MDVKEDRLISFTSKYQLAKYQLIRFPNLVKDKATEIFVEQLVNGNNFCHNYEDSQGSTVFKESNKTKKFSRQK